MKELRWVYYQQEPGAEISAACEPEFDFLNPATRAIVPSTMSTKRMERESGGAAAGTAGLAALKVPMVDCSFVHQRCAGGALRD
jgi:hypothetical protein